jgi:predicted DCC family thiol-disulfide oxidoreductase YuxK
MKMSIVIYDGECQFCNKLICFVKNKLKRKEMLFLPYSSKEARDIIADYKINKDSIAYIKDEIVYFKSKAVLKICRQLKLPYYLAHFLKVLPTFLLDSCYDFVAKNRYRLTNKKKCCNG